MFCRRLHHEAEGRGRGLGRGLAVRQGEPVQEAAGGGLDLSSHHPVFIDEQGDLDRLVLAGVVGELVGVPLDPFPAVLAEVEALIGLELEVAGVAVVELLWDEQLLSGDGLGTSASPGR